MEPHSWRNLGVEGRPPTPAVSVIAVVLFYLLNQQHDTALALAVAVAVIGLDCVRIRRTEPESPQPTDITGGAAGRTKRL
ncbi:hypothetical protein JK361_26045 [Streptomyces sp. 5-8]|uniref:Uncharacterized protein n=1 Tax=Streptomyces musisoli TaxID=2802280 RepID=A0ABS1P756_9ACTN|nr:hypothetical protein [Streptomyces musisoli]MBL1108009.1 hypothetical protein [Streptomyces musisoli]